jgi:hypothetical protein
MNRWSLAGGLLVLGLLWPGTMARADRITGQRVVTQPNTGTRTDITVPYTTDGRSALMVGGRVQPRIYSSPQVDTKVDPGVPRTYNLIFYGSKQAFGTASEGATPRPAFTPIPR